MHRSLKALLALSLASLLSACGGGGESSGGVPPSGSAAHNTDTGANVNAPFSAEVAMAPAEGAELSGIVRLEVGGSKMANVELLPANGYLPKHGVFRVKEDGSFAWLNLDTATLPNGPITVRISAFDVPAGQPGAKEIIAMQPRTWNINNAGEGSTAPFSASVATAPADGAAVSGITRLEIRGNGIANAELLPASGYTPRLGVFNVSEDKSYAWLDFDTSSIPDGTREVRISAFDVPAGQAGAKEIIAMPARTWAFNNGASDAFAATVTMAPPHDAMLQGMTRLEVRGSGMENVELLPAYGYEPKFGTFTISPDKTFAYLDIDTQNLPEGTFSARISAFNAPAGSSSASEIIAMPPRQWQTPIANGTPAPGPLTDVQLDNPALLAADANGNLYVVDGPYDARQIRKIAPDGNVTTLTEEKQYIGGLAVSASGDVFYTGVMDQNGDASARRSVLRRIGIDGTSGDVTLNGETIGALGRIAIDQKGDIYFLATSSSTDGAANTTAKRVSQDGTVTDLFSLPGLLQHIAVQGDTVWVANVQLRGDIYFYRWTGSGDPQQVTIQRPEFLGGMIATESGLYFTKYNYARAVDEDNRCTVNRLDPDTGAISHIAGAPTETCGYREGDGEAALFSRLLDIAQGSDGDFYVADYNNHVIRRVTPDGEVFLFAGVPGQPRNN